MTIIDGRYELVDQVDSGYRSKIYTAIDLYTNSTVAIKILNKGIITNKNFISNFIDETTIINEHNSENVVKIFDVGIYSEDGNYDDYSYYIVSEYIHGSGLDKFTKYVELNLEQIISIFRQIVKVLDIAHKHNIYHGDIQPHNIIIDEGLNVKINNFGLVNANSNLFRNNLENTVKNIKYLSPQQLCIGHCDEYSDFYSLGIVMFELLFKNYPYKGEFLTSSELLGIMDKGINWKIVDSEGIPDEIVNIIKKLLSRSEKYKNCEEIMIDISHYLYFDIDKPENVEINDEMQNTTIYTDFKNVNLNNLENTIVYKKKKKFLIF